MANWLNQLQSLLGQSRSSTSSSADQGLGKLLVPGALGGLAGLLVANKAARKLLTKYGTNALLVGGGAVAGTVLWNKYKDKIRAAHQDEPQFGVMAPIASGTLPPSTLIHSFLNWKSLVAIAVGVIVSWLGGRGVTLMGSQPQLVAGLLVGTVLGVALFRGVPVGPLIAAGLVSLIVGKQ